MLSFLKIYLIINCLFCLFFAVQVHADIYRYEDSDGMVHFTDNAMPGFRKFLSRDGKTNQVSKNSELDGYYIQMGPFNSMKMADNLKKKLRAMGIDAISYQQGRHNYGVWFGNFQTRDEATAEAEKLVSTKVIHKYFVSNEVNYPIETQESQLAEKSKIMEKAIKAVRFEVKYYTECSPRKNGPEPNIVCIMVFPEKRGNMRYIHKIEALTLGMVYAFARNDSAEPFELYAIMKDGGDKIAADKIKQSNIHGDFAGVCAYSYSKHFDQIDTLWPPI